MDISRLNDLLVNENGFAFDPGTGFTYNLSLSALGVLRGLKDGKTEDALVAHLMDEYDVEARRAQRDVEDFLSALVRYGLVKPASGRDGI